MSFNVWLGLIAVGLGWTMYLIQNRLGKLLFGIGWLIFIPNTIYMITDVYHIGDQWYEVSNVAKIFLYFQYALLFSAAIATFICALYPFEKLLQQSKLGKKESEQILFLVLMNILVAFGVVLGRVLRTNSWYVITDPQRVAMDILNVFMSTRLLVLVILFSIIGNVLYFSFKKELVLFLKDLRRYKFARAFSL